MDDSQKSDSIKEGEVLQIANNILSLLDYSKQLTDEDVLFSDEFYISILSNLLIEQNKEIKPGETPEEKATSLKQLIKLLSEIIEMDLSQIKAEGIIMHHDKASAKSLLELIEELIKTLMNANLEEENSEKKNGKEESEKESIELIDENNNRKSENNLRKIRERMNLDEDEDNNEENSSYKRKYAELEDGIDNLDDVNNLEEEDEIKSEEKKEKKIMDINYDIGDKNNLSGSHVMNVSHISEMEKNKIQETSSSKQNNKEKNSGNKKKYNEVPDLLINKIKEDRKVAKNKNYIDDNEQIELDEENIKYDNYLESNSNNVESNIYDEENIYIPQSVPRAYNKLHLSNNSKESESSNNNNKYIRSKKKSNKKESSSNSNSNISFHSKKNTTKDNNIDISSTNKRIEISTNKKAQEKNNLKESKTSSKQTSIKDINNIEEEDDISKSSEYSNAQKSEKSAKSSASKKSQKSQKSKMSNKPNNIPSKINILEIPMSDEEIKYMIKKELRKLYGEKASQYFKKEFLITIGENLKMARKAIIQYETGLEADDFFSREFFNKYLKEMQKIIKNCVRELNKEKQYKKNVIFNNGNNINVIKKLKDFENKEISNEIESKKKELDERNDKSNMKILNQILMYPSYCFELQKQIYLAQTQSQIELNYAIEKEREKNLEETRKNYEDRIMILNEILRRQKKERVNKKKYGELLDYELKNMKKNKLKKQVEDLLDQIDDEDNNNLVEDNNDNNELNVDNEDNNNIVDNNDNVIKEENENEN